MTSRYVPNETTCPIPVELLALLLRSDEPRVVELISALPAQQRAALAVFCYARSHMRSLGFQIAATCDVRALRVADGIAWQNLVTHSGGVSSFDSGPKSQVKRAITLARFAA